MRPCVNERKPQCKRSSAEFNSLQFSALLPVSESKGPKEQRTTSIRKDENALPPVENTLSRARLVILTERYVRRHRINDNAHGRVKVERSTLDGVDTW